MYKLNDPLNLHLLPQGEKEEKLSRDNILHFYRKEEMEECDMGKNSVLCIFILLFAAGCATAGREKVKEAGMTAPAEVVEARTCAQRVLPGQYKPGERVSVTLKVFPAPETSGVIVEEVLPEGWEMKKSSPQWMQRHNNVYKWLAWGGSIEPFEILYEVMPSEEARGEAEFRGSVKTHREKSSEIEGDRSIIPAE